MAFYQSYAHLLSFSKMETIFLNILCIIYFMGFFFLQSNEVKGSSHMELAGLKRAMGFLKDHVNIKTLVTDRHSMVKKYMKDCHAEKNHYFDVWHIAKGNSG